MASEIQAVEAAMGSEFSSLVEQLWAWVEVNILTWDLLMQGLAVALAAGLGLLLGGMAHRAFERQFARRMGGVGYEAKILKAIDRVFWLVMASVLLTLARIGFDAMEEPSRLLGIASVLALAWIAIRLASGLILNHFWGKVVSVVVWIMVALNMVGLLGPVLECMDGLGMDIGGGRVTLLQVLKAGLLFLVLYQAAAAVSKYTTEKLNSHPQLTPSSRTLFTKGTKFALFSIAFLLSLSTAGVDLTSLAVLSGAIGVGIGFGLQKVFANLASGIILLMERSLKPGDTVEVEGTYGVVTSLNMRYSAVRTRDGKEFLIPNENLITNTVTLWTHQDPNVRLKIPVGISYDSDPRQAMALLEQAATETQRVLDNPKPAARLVGYGDNSIDLEIRAWIKDSSQGIVNVRSELLLKVWDLFKEQGVEMPYPQRDVHIKTLPKDFGK